MMVSRAEKGPNGGCFLVLVALLLWWWVLYAAVMAMTGTDSGPVSEERRQVVSLCLESGSLTREEAVDNPVDAAVIAVSNSLDIDQALQDKHPEGGIKKPAALCGKPF